MNKKAYAFFHIWDEDGAVRRNIFWLFYEENLLCAPFERKEIHWGKGNLKFNIFLPKTGLILGKAWI